MNTDTTEIDAAISSNWMLPALHWIETHLPQALEGWDIDPSDDQALLAAWIGLLQVVETLGADMQMLGEITAQALSTQFAQASVHVALQKLARDYRTHHGGLLAGNGISVSSSHFTTMIVNTSTSYPDAFEYGLIAGTVHAASEYEALYDVEQYHTLGDFALCPVRTYVIRVAAGH